MMKERRFPLKGFDKFLSAVILGALAPVILMLLFWWGSIPFIKNNNSFILCLAAAGFFAGILLDFSVLRKFILRLFDLPRTALAAIEIFYSFMIYGFFMGFPVFNSFVGIVGSYIIVQKCVAKKSTSEEIAKDFRFIIAISSIILFFLCVSTAYLALREPTIRSQVQGMLSLPFPVTQPMIWGLILAGGGFLLLFQYCSSKYIIGKVLAKR